MNRPSTLLAAALLALAPVALAGCKTAADPLAPFRKQCQDLQAKGELKAGLALEDCAKSLKTASDENDPARRADALAARLQPLAQQAAGKPLEAQDELRLAVGEVQALGKPAVAPLQARFEASRDPEVRIALAKALVSLCFDDCAAQKFDCIVPALLEGLGKDKPVEVRAVSVQGLARCTGKEYGDDPAAWTSWWASVKPHP